MQLSTALSLSLASISLVVPSVTANPWGNPLLKAREIPTCSDGHGAGCDDGPWDDMEECEYQCYGAENDSGDICYGNCQQMPGGSGPGPILCFCDGS